MATDKLGQLLSALQSGTANGQIVWQDLPDEEMFRTHVNGGMVRIGKAESGSNGYQLWLMVPGGAIAGEWEILTGEAHYDLIEDLYSQARLASRGGDELIERIIRSFPQMKR